MMGMLSKWKNALFIAGTATLMLAVLVIMEWNIHQSSSLPQSIVTTFRGDPSVSRAFSWRTGNPDAAAVVQVVRDAEGAGFQQEDVLSFTGYSYEDSLAAKGLDGVHKAEATGLEPDTGYLYRVGSGEQNGWSEPARFSTAPSEEEGFTFINVADSQGETEADFKLWSRTLEQAAAMFPAAKFIVHNGDLTENPAYGQGWAYLFGTAQRLLRQLAFMPVTGNHDEVDGNAEPFASYFYLPDNGASGSNEGTSYSFDYGSVHFAVLNSESNIDKQTKWLRNDLANTDKPWKVVAVHRGPYGGNSYKKVEDWVSVIDEYQVDLVLQGHNHEYSRSYPLRDREIAGNGDDPVTDRAGTVYVVTNTSGPKFNEKKEDQFYHKVHFQNEMQMFAAITVEGDTLTYQAYDASGRLLDQFILRH